MEDRHDGTGEWAILHDEWASREWVSVTRKAKSKMGVFPRCYASVQRIKHFFSERQSEQRFRVNSRSHTSEVYGRSPRSQPSSQPARHAIPPQPPSVLTTMAETSKRPKEREGAVSTLNAAIEALNLAKEISSITPAKAAFGSVSVVLAMIRVGFLLVNGFP